MKKLRVNSSVYSAETIRASMKAYQKHAITTVKYKLGYSEITFWKCRYDGDLTVKEFENYMIGIENS